MTNSQRLALVRERLHRWLRDQNESDCSSESDSENWSESILIRDGFYCGRRFESAAFRAVWFFEEDELKVYSVDGQLQCVITGAEIEASHQEAASAEDSAGEEVEAEKADILSLPTADERRNDVPGEDQEPIRRAA